jgi:hypothetical protein
MSSKHGLAVSAKLILIIGTIDGTSGAQELAVGVLQPTVFHGTTYAVERTPEMVALSIDSSRSKLVAPNSKAADRNMHAVCKIQASAGTVFVTAGIVGLGNERGDGSTHNAYSSMLLPCAISALTTAIS